MNDKHWLELACGDETKAQELKQKDEDRKTARTSAINKLKGATYSALTDAEAKALFGE